METILNALLSMFGFRSVRSEYERMNEVLWRDEETRRMLAN